jgi:hypothetical protein
MSPVRFQDGLVEATRLNTGQMRKIGMNDCPLRIKVCA